MAGQSPSWKGKVEKERGEILQVEGSWGSLLALGKKKIK